MYLLQVYLVTMETFAVQRSRSSPPSQWATPHLRTPLTNKKCKPCAWCASAAVPRFYRTKRFVNFTLEAKLVSSKHLIQVHLEILSCSVENMASHLMTRYITWRLKLSSLRSWLESWNRCTCTSCPWLPFLTGQECSECGLDPTWRRTLASLHCERFHSH